ncbi:MAG: hypothetical protein GWP91_13390 [Rhodobacterales bacterium]|nr:hypothetical protein [Rhodobacterales bacterium]
MVRISPWLCLALLGGCAAHKVQMEVAASPAVALETRTVAVIAQERECKPVADELVAVLRASDLFVVDPHANVQLKVFSCGVDIGWTLYQEVDESGGDRQRADLDGRGHAVVAVTQDGQTRAHLVGNGRDGHIGAWRAQGIRDMFRTRHAMQSRLTQAVAQDVVTQLDPMPQQYTRKLYANAGKGTAKDLHNLAVLAEQGGDLREAIRLASAALAERPNARIASYLDSLERRSVTTPARPPIH